MCRQWRHLFAVISLGVVCVSAQAAWTYMGHLDGNTVLIDRSSIQLKKRNALVWMLTNYSTVNANQLMSLATHLEFDCDKNQVRYVQLYGYEGQMQSGARLMTVVEPGQWVAVEHGTLMKSFQQIACLRGPNFRQEGVLNKPPK